VTLRTLRYYDREGLLSPSAHTESGYRLYSDTDLVVLQQILALKLLGLPLAEIKSCLKHGPNSLVSVLVQQQAMIEEKRKQLDAIVLAIEQAIRKLQNGEADWDVIVGVIEVLKMEQNTEWVKKYFTEEQLATMQELGAQSYSGEAAQKMAQWPAWTEADQEKASAQWKHIGDESERLAAENADPGGEEAQALAKLKTDLLQAFTKGDPDIKEGLRQFWQNHNALPESQQPLAKVPGAPSGPGADFLNRAMEIYQKAN
jgi:DNA-binding transcriptional MerR regulator